MNKLLYTLLLLMTIGFVSCETDIDVNAEYKDIPVVYGVIDPSESNHYIRINKAFLGETNALDLAADANNFNYANGELDVTMEEWNGETKVTSYPLTRTVNEIPKDPGIFDNSTNVLYKFVEPSINKNNTYKLKIVNSGLNKEINAETEIVGNTNVSFPAGTNQNFKFWIGSPTTGTEFDETKIGVTTGENVGRAEAKLHFTYVEFYTTASMKPSVVKTIVMPLGEERTTTSLGQESLEWELKGGTFFQNIIGGVSDPSTVADFSHRELDNISIEFIIAGTELSVYMDVSAPSNTINQDKPSYTNVTNGLGILSSREKIWYISSKVPANGFVNINNETILYLKSKNLGFCFGTSATSGFKCTQL